MRHTISNWIGFAFVAVGFVLLLGAAGNSDLNYEMSDIIPYIKAGFVSMIGGLLISKL